MKAKTSNDLSIKAQSHNWGATGYALVVLTFAVFALGIFSIFEAWKLSFADKTMLPFWDQWSFVMQMVAHHGGYSSRELWQQHNEHRIVLLRLFLLADWHWFRATGTFIIVSSLLIQTTTAIVFWEVIRSACSTMTLSLRLWLVGFVAICVFSPVQLDNFVWPFQICFILVTLCSVASFYFFSLMFKGPSGNVYGSVNIGLFALALLAAVCSTLSLASGLFTWPVLCVFCLALRTQWRVLGIVFLATILATFSYFYSYRSPLQHANPFDSIQHPAQLATYLAALLGGSWAPFGLTSSIVVGWIGLLLAATLLSAFVLRIRSVPFYEVFLAAVTSWVLLSGAITALGRINFGLEQALSSRYQTPAMTFWVAVGLWSLLLFERTFGRRWLLATAELLFLIIAAGPLLRFKAIVNPYFGRAGQWRAAEMASLSDVSDRMMMKSVSPDVLQTEPSMPYLRRNRISVFASPLYSLLGTPLASSYQVDQNTKCAGSITEKEITYGPMRGIKMYGWAWNSQTNSEFSTILLVDNNGTISGFGAGGYFFPGRAPVYLANEPTGWVGYSKAHAGFTTVHAYAVLKDRHTVCAIGERQDVSSLFSPYDVRVSAITRALAEGDFGVFRGGQWWSHRPDRAKASPTFPALTIFGQPGDMPIVGDWDGTGKLRIGVFREGQWWLDINGNGRWDPGIDRFFVFGQPGDVPIVGDWDNTGKLRIGVFRGGQWWLDMNGNNRWDSGIDKLLVFGQSGDIPIVGDWDGTGRLRIGVFRKGQWWLDINGDDKWTSADKVFVFGGTADMPVIGNWDHSGKLRIGVFHNGHWLLDLNGNNQWDGADLDQDMIFGQTGDIAPLFPWPTE